MRKLLDAILSQCGFRPDRLTLGWMFGGVVSFGISEAVRARDDLFASALYFTATCAFYYLGNALYLSRLSAGARGLQGEAAERAWRLYQCLLGLMFFNQGLGFTAMASLTFPGSTLPAPQLLCEVVGCALVAVGIVTKTWATLVVGVDCYFYKDLFFKRPVWRFSREGPYAVLANPMYGAGNLHVFGLAIFGRSVPALVAAAVCLAAIYSFHFSVERPFVREMSSTQHESG